MDTLMQRRRAMMALRAGGGGSSGLTLLASGSFTKTGTGVTLTIPVSFTGTPKLVVVEVDAPLANTNQGYSAGKYFITADDPAAVQSAVPEGMAHARYLKSDGTYVGTIYAPGSIYFNGSNLCFGRISGTYLWQPNTYNWYIYG